MIDKRQIESYLLLYPKIDEEIKSLEEDLKFFENEKNKYENQTVLNKIDSEMLEAAKDGYDEKLQLLCEHTKAKIAIMRSLSKAGFRNRKVIELRFWKHGVPSKWDDVARIMGISKSSAERFYREFIENVKEVIN